MVLDWTRGLIVATGASAADLRSPSPGVARVKAQRRARNKARARLLARLRAVPMAKRNIGVFMDGDAQARQRIEGLLDNPTQVATDYSSDGSVVLRMSLSLESVRRAISGTPTTAGDALKVAGRSAPTIVIDAGEVLDRPILGLAVALDGVGSPHLGPVVFHKNMTAALADSRANARVVTVRASGVEVGRDGEQVQSGPVLRVARAHGASAHERRKRGKRRRGKASVDEVVGALAQGALVIVVLGAH